MERITSGVPGLDELIGGGLPKGRTFLVSGSCGTGKTILASQFINEGALKGEKGLYITFEQERHKLIEDMAQVGIDFEKHEKEKILTIIANPVGRVIRFRTNTEADLLDLVEEIEDIIKDCGATRVTMDSVTLFTMLFEKEGEKRAALAKLTSMLENHDCTALLLCEVRENSRDISWHGFEEFVVDGVITMFRKHLDTTFEREIGVVKMRGVEQSPNLYNYQIKQGGIVIHPEQTSFHD